MTSSKNYIVFFDLDKTLTNSVSGKALATAAFRKDCYQTGN
jgi:hypothetical protein